MLADTWHFIQVCSCVFGASERPWIKRVQSTRLHCVNRLCWVIQSEKGKTLRHNFSAQEHTVCLLPCSSGNSPTSSDNLDQSVGSMNPRLPGAQGKISRPSQVVRDWRHEITFSVFGLVLSQQTQHQSRIDGKKEVGEFYSAHSSLASVRGRTSAPTLVMRSPPQSIAPGCKTLTHSNGEYNIHGHARVCKTIPLFQNK